MSFKEIYPPSETAIDLEPQELAPFLLRHLDDLGDNLSRHNYTLESNPSLRDYAGERTLEFTERLVEAWILLERELLIAPKPGSDGQWYFITRRGKKLVDSQDFETYIRANVLDFAVIDPILARKVKPLYLRGDYDTAIFQAFKEVEIRIRKKGNYSNSDIGVPLVRKAFDTANGPLTDVNADPGEKEAMGNLFAGAIGLFKNPSSHHDAEYDDPNEAADLIHFANHLLRILDNIG